MITFDCSQSLSIQEYERMTSAKVSMPLASWLPLIFHNETKNSFYYSDD
jgi:hypothetical protein